MDKCVFFKHLEKLRDDIYNTYENKTVFKELISPYQKTLQEIQLLRESFLYLPFDVKSSYTSLQNFIMLLYERNEIETVQKIIQVLPEQSLQCLFSSTFVPTYKNRDIWINLIKDEDDYEEVKIWIRRVKGGKKTPEWFNQKVKEANFDIQ